MPADPRNKAAAANSSVIIASDITVNGTPLRPRWEAGAIFSMNEPPAVIKAALDKAFVDLRARVDEELGFR